MGLLGKFQKSIWWPLLIGIIILICRWFSADIICFCILAGLASLTLFFNDDILAFLPILLMGIFAVSAGQVKYNNVHTDVYNNTKSIIILCSLAVIVFIALVTRLIKSRDVVGKVKPSIMGFTILIFSISLAIGGLNFSDYKWSSLWMGLLLGVCYYGVFFFFKHTLVIDKNSFARICSFMIVVGFMLLVQLTYIYTLFPPFQEHPCKGNILTGWGQPNSVGSFLLVCLPFPYAMMQVHKDSVIKVALFTINEILLCGGLVLTMSRTCILTGILICAVLYLVTLIKLPFHSKWALIGTTIWAVATVSLVYVIFSQKLDFVWEYFRNSKFDDSGRFEIFREGIETFKQHFILGTGIMNRSEEMFYTYFYHNTVIQMLACCGIVGGVAYIFHRIWFIVLAIKNMSYQNLIFIMTAIAIIFNGLFDIAFFAHNIVFVYITCMIFIEKNKRINHERL